LHVDAQWTSKLDTEPTLGKDWDFWDCIDRCCVAHCRAGKNGSCDRDCRLETRAIYSFAPSRRSLNPWKHLTLLLPKQVNTVALFCGLHEWAPRENEAAPWMYRPESDSRQDKLFFDDIISLEISFRDLAFNSSFAFTRASAFDPDARRNYSLPSIRVEDTRLEKLLGFSWRDTCVRAVIIWTRERGFSDRGFLFLRESIRLLRLDWIPRAVLRSRVKDTNTNTHRHEFQG